MLVHLGLILFFLCPTKAMGQLCRPVQMHKPTGHACCLKKNRTLDIGFRQQLFPPSPVRLFFQVHHRSADTVTPVPSFLAGSETRETAPQQDRTSFFGGPNSAHNKAREKTREQSIQTLLLRQSDYTRMEYQTCLHASAEAIRYLTGVGLLWTL